jgi:hypothetical protein
VERIKKNEVSRNKKLTHWINMATSENAPNWAKDFLQELSSGAINSTTFMAEFVHFSLNKHFDLVSSRKIILTKINN